MSPGRANKEPLVSAGAPADKGDARLRLEEAPRVGPSQVVSIIGPLRYHNPLTNLDLVGIKYAVVGTSDLLDRDAVSNRYH